MTEGQSRLDLPPMIGLLPLKNRVPEKVAGLKNFVVISLEVEVQCKKRARIRALFQRVRDLRVTRCSRQDECTCQSLRIVAGF